MSLFVVVHPVFVLSMFILLIFPTVLTLEFFLSFLYTAKRDMGSYRHCRPQARYVSKYACLAGLCQGLAPKPGASTK